MAKKKSLGSKRKIQIYIQDLIKQEPFQKEVAKIRGKYGIPDIGFDYSKQIPVFIKPLKEWVKTDGIRALPLGWEATEEEDVELDKESILLAEKFGIITVKDTVRHYILFNRIPEEDQRFSDLIDLDDQVVAKDVLEQFKTFSDTDSNLKLRYQKLSEYYDKLHEAFPVVLRISPYASLRDIVDFVNKHSEDIRTIQNRHKKKSIQVGRVRSRDAFVQERNQFIYDNEGKPLKDISMLLRKKYGTKGILDEGHISKIISLTKKKRK